MKEADDGGFHRQSIAPRDLGAFGTAVVEKTLRELQGKGIPP